MCNLIKVRA